MYNTIVSAHTHLNLRHHTNHKGQNYIQQELSEEVVLLSLADAKLHVATCISVLLQLL